MGWLLAFSWGSLFLEDPEACQRQERDSEFLVGMLGWQSGSVGDSQLCYWPQLLLETKQR